MRTSILLLLGLLALAPRAESATVLERGFTDTVFVPSGLSQLTGMAWATDGSNRLYVTRKSGEIHLVKDGVLQPTLFAKVSPIQTHDWCECGLVGIAIDPAFASNRYLYVFVTVSESEQQIIRYTDVDGIGTDKTVILGGLPTRGANHDGGGLAFGPDGRLYFGVGDTGTSLGANDDLATLGSKIGRVNRDGTAPEDNPFFDGPGPNNDYIWARGFRNPFGLTFEPGTGRLWVNVAGDAYEQVFVPRAGDHAGWNTYENYQPEGFLTPVINYRTHGNDVRQLTPQGAERRDNVVTFTTSQPHGFHPGERISVFDVGDVAFHGDFYIASVTSSTSFTVAQKGPDVRSSGGTVSSHYLGGSITGGAFYTGTTFPPPYRGNFFFGDFVSGQIIRATLGADGTVTRVDPFATDVPEAVAVATGPDGALYYAEFSSGIIHRVTWSAPAPRVGVSRTRLSVDEGQTTSFSVHLEDAPTAPITLTTTFLGAESMGLSVVDGGSLTFTPDNFATPQTVTLFASSDEDARHVTVTVLVGGPGMEPRSVDVQLLDDDGVDLVLSSTAMSLEETARATLYVSLASAPPGDVVLKATRWEGERFSIASGETLTFTPANHATPQAVVIQGLYAPDAKDTTGTLQLQGAGALTRTVALTIQNTDTAPPLILSEPVTAAVVGAPYRYEVKTLGNPPPTYSLSEELSGMSIDPRTGVISWIPSTPGTYEIPVVATNDHGTATQSFMLTVTEAPDPADAGTADGGTPPDAGSAPDAGSPLDAGTEPDAGSDPGKPSGGCGCTSGLPAGNLLLWAMLLGAHLATRRRR
ncbi:PQQ-dependent sugar dehydrogenase [Archangium violaceum]|uniref:PQQ-dependent sugar dehydrogenase n=1 Tax=Archangium violaceum TaxID=83451 RepID=UPI00193C198F|nr:PQQ-dependent sugar dehydrogenase [Archangium violaceum]QRK06928.1 PQQ-dependent sugar dehydrogenase [Archangium violaceum]